MIKVNEYRSHSCGELRTGDVGKKAVLAGWVDTVRDHGGVLFLDLRDSFGITQVVLHDDVSTESLAKETVVSISGEVCARTEENFNNKIATGKIELKAENIRVLGKSLGVLPFEIYESTDSKEEVRLRYRFLDLRNPAVHDKIVLRSKIIGSIRNAMNELDFLEIQTPILTASSPEGARDYIIPSRKHPGRFYALPQAPQMFKQLLMVSGFDRYFQIAPCFRDEDARADRSPGEFYQLDFEMAFATQEDVLTTAEQVMYKVFSEFAGERKISPAPFPRITYADSMLKYGSDKPDLRNPLEIIDLSDLFAESSFASFKGKTVRAISVPDCASKPKSFYEKMLAYATEIGMKGLGYCKVNEDMSFNGPIDKFLDDASRAEITARAALKPGCTIFFIADSKTEAPKLAGLIRTELGECMDLIDKNSFEFCYIVDFPMFELDENGAYAFTHNPFSMPQGGLEALENTKPDEIVAYQYDIVCNGSELSSGAVRNHDLDIMKKAFAIAGYTEEDLKTRFGSLYTAFSYGAPPHAGMAPGIDRIVQLLSGEKNIREVIAFPMTSTAQDLLMGSPGEVSEEQLRDVHIRLRTVPGKDAQK